MASRLEKKSMSNGSFSINGKYIYKYGRSLGGEMVEPFKKRLCDLVRKDVTLPWHTLVDILNVIHANVKDTELYGQ